MDRQRGEAHLPHRPTSPPMGPPARGHAPPRGHTPQWKPPRGTGRVAAHRREARARRGRRILAVCVTVVTVAALATGGWFTLGALSCMEPPPVSIVAGPAVAPFLDRMAQEERASGTCAAFTVTSRPDALAAETLSISDGSAPPQVWVPESSVMLARAATLGATGLPSTGTSIGTSPMVMALAPDAAAQLGWPDNRPTWYDVVGNPEITLGVPDPSRDPLGLAALLEVRATTTTQADPDTAFTATLRRLSANTVVEGTQLFDNLPGMPGVTDPVVAFPTSELALLRHNVHSPELPLTAVYPQTERTALDFPFAVLDSASAEQREAAAALLERLLTPEGQAVLAEGGFRTPQGIMLRDRTGDRRTLSATLSFGPLTQDPVTDDVLSRWAVVNRSARVQVLLDVSGSMNAEVPGLGMTRMEVMVQANERGLALFQPTTRIGYRAFSTNLDGDLDYRELLPVQPVQDVRTEPNLQVLRTLAATRDGDTGLFDSVLAAYRDAQAAWEPGRLNLVVAMTDGNNDDDDSITQEQLLAELAATADPQRPVVLMGVGIGPDIDPSELQAITEPTGGQVLIAEDPADIEEVFFTALGSLS